MGVDRDEDLVLNGVDNCPAAPNGPGGGTCTAGDAALLATQCSIGAECGAMGVCSANQEDTDVDLVGDACEPSLVPEPSAILMLGVGTALLAGLGRRRAVRF